MTRTTNKSIHRHQEESKATMKPTNRKGKKNMTKRNSKSRANSSTVTLSTDILRTAMNAFAKLPMAKKHESLHIRSADPHTLELQVYVESESLCLRIATQDTLPRFDTIEVCTASVSAALALWTRDMVPIAIQDGYLTLGKAFIAVSKSDLSDEYWVKNEEDDEEEDCYDEWCNHEYDFTFPTQFFDILEIVAPFANNKDYPGITFWDDLIAAGDQKNLIYLPSTLKFAGPYILHIPSPAALVATGYRGPCDVQYGSGYHSARFSAGPWTWTVYDGIDDKIPPVCLLEKMPEMPIVVTLSPKEAKLLTKYLSYSTDNVDIFVDSGYEARAYFTTGCNGCMIPASKNRVSFGMKAHIDGGWMFQLLKRGCTEFGFSCGSTYFTAKFPQGKCLCSLFSPATPVFDNTELSLI